MLALDIGGTKLAAAVVANGGAILASGRDLTPRTDDGEQVFWHLEHLCQRVIEEARLAERLVAIGVGCGGPMRYPEGVVSTLHIPAWRGFPLRQRLSDAFHLPCVVDNDAKALALGEWWLGAGRGEANLLGMVISTGVGGGAIVDGRLLHGKAGNAGHVGHVVVWPDGPLCGCGARGCLEAVASGTGLARRLAAAQAEGAPTSVAHGARAEGIAAAARAGDPLARDLFRTAGEAVGRGIASAAALLAIDRVVVGGSVALYAWDLLGPPLRKEVERSACLDFTRGVRIQQAALGERAGLLGAAALALGAVETH